MTARTLDEIEEEYQKHTDVENPRREAYKAWAFGWFLRNVLRRDAEFSLADVEEPPERERRTPILGSGPWYAKAVRGVGFVLIAAQAVKIVDWLLPMTGLNPSVDTGTVILVLIGVALVYLGKTLEGSGVST